MKNLFILHRIQSIYSRYIESLSLDQRKKVAAYFYISLTLLTVSFFGFFAVTPTLSTIANLEKQYDDNKLILDSLNKKLSSLTLLDFQYNQIQQDLERIYLAIPRTPRIPYLTRQLETIADESNVLVRSFNVGRIEIYPNTKNDSIYSFNFTINIVGDEQGINGFVSRLISFDRIVGIDKISTGKNDEERFEASIIGRAFFSNK